MELHKQFRHIEFFYNIKIANFQLIDFFLRARTYMMAFYNVYHSFHQNYHSYLLLKGSHRYLLQFFQRILFGSHLQKCQIN